MSLPRTTWPISSPRFYRPRPLSNFVIKSYTNFQVTSVAERVRKLTFNANTRSELDAPSISAPVYGLATGSPRFKYFFSPRYDVIRSRHRSEQGSNLFFPIIFILRPTHFPHGKITLPQKNAGENLSRVKLKHDFLENLNPCQVSLLTRSATYLYFPSLD